MSIVRWSFPIFLVCLGGEGGWGRGADMLLVVLYMFPFNTQHIVHTSIVGREKNTLSIIELNSHPSLFCVSRQC